MNCHPGGAEEAAGARGRGAAQEGGSGEARAREKDGRGGEAEAAVDSRAADDPKAQPNAKTAATPATAAAHATAAAARAAATGRQQCHVQLPRAAPGEAAPFDGEEQQRAEDDPRAAHHRPAARDHPQDPKDTRAGRHQG